jgi:hypothetical protein
MSYLPDTHRRPFIAALVIALVLLAGSLGVAKSASTAAPERPAAIVERVLPPPKRLVHAEASPVRHHFAKLEVDSGEARGAIETASLGSAPESGVPAAPAYRPRP